MTSDRRRIAAWSVAVIATVLVLVAVVVTSLESPDVEPSPATLEPLIEPRIVLGRQPNIVVIMVDDMRDDDLRFMPRTRRLIGGQGVRFVNSFSPYPSCCPARASVLTGQYTHNHGVFTINKPYAFPSFDDSSTLATWLQDAGYATVYLGKYLNGYGRMPEPGRESGTSVRYVPPGWDRWHASIDGGLPQGHPAAGSTYHYFDTTISLDGTGFRSFAGRYQTRAYGDLSERVIRRRAKSDRPYFFYASYTAPHSGEPFERDDPLPLLRADSGITAFPTAARPRDARGRFDQLVTAAPGASWRDPDFSDKPPYLQPLRPLTREDRAALLTMTRQRAEAMWVLDRQVERTIRAVDDSGEADRTVVLFTSDNGYFLGEQRRRSGKILPHEPSLRTPLLIRGPGIPAGERRNDPITSIDIAPTIAALAGFRPPDPVDGVSLAGVARHGDKGWTRGILTESGPYRQTRRLRFLLGVRTWRYLFVESASGHRELYDVQRDPRQYHNLADLPAYADVQLRLARALARLQTCDGPACATPLPGSLRQPPGARR